MGKKYEEEMEQEVNKRVTQISMQFNNLNDLDEEIDINDFGQNEESIKSLKAEIKRLEKNNRRDQDMFFKHNQIFEHKLEQEKNDKNMLNEKIKTLQNLHEEEVRELNNKIVEIKQELQTQNRVSSTLQDNLNAILKEKENELNEVKGVISKTEDENKSLRVSVTAHSETIQELQSMLKGNENVDDQIEEEYIKLIDLLQIELKEAEMSKITLLKNLGVEMDRMRAEIKKQYMLNVGS